MGRKKSVKYENIALDSKKQKEFEKKIEQVEGEELVKPGTIYIGHIPHGFYENEIRGYFSQFGVINKVRLARSKKTGGWKGYGYVQFANEDVAQIAADAMNNYLMFDKLLKCVFVPPEKLHPRIWKGANQKFVWLNHSLKEKTMHNRERSKEERKKICKKLVSKDNAKRKKLLALGICYEFPGYKTSMAKKTKKVTTGNEKKLKSKKAKRNMPE